LCLFFEEAHESTQDGVNKLVDKGPFDHSRWKLLKAMHIVIPNERTVQGYLVRHAHTPHYMRLFQEFCRAFSAFPGSMEIHIYQPHINHATDFLSVLNINLVQIIGGDPYLESSSLSRINLNLVHQLMRGGRGDTMTMDTQETFPHPRLDPTMGLQDPI
jgi:hypothetical protein